MARDESVRLSEITSIKGDADLAYGGPLFGTDVELPWNKAIDYLATAAREKAAATKYKYDKFQQNVQDFYTSMKDLDVNGLMDADYPSITEEYASLAHDIANNYDVIANPIAHQEKYAEFKQKEANLRSNIQRSKGNLAYLKLHEEFVKGNPDMNTEGNKARMIDFQNSALGSRKPFQLDTPFVWDPKAFADVANKAAEAEVQNVKRLNNGFLEVTKEKKIRADAYMNAWNQITRSTTDKLGRTAFDAASQTYNQLPESFRQGKTTDQLHEEVGRSLMNQNDKLITWQTDPVYMENLNFAHQKSLEEMRNKFKDQDDERNAEFLNTETTKIFMNDGGKTLNLQLKRKGENAFKTESSEKIIENVSPTVYDMFTIIVDDPTGKDGKKIVKPELFTKTANGNIRPIYFDKDESGNTIEATQGKLYLPNYSQPISPDQFKMTLAKYALGHDPKTLVKTMSLSNQLLLSNPDIKSESLDNGNYLKYAKIKNIVAGNLPSPDAKKVEEPKPAEPVKKPKPY